MSVNCLASTVRQRVKALVMGFKRLLRVGHEVARGRAVPARAEPALEAVERATTGPGAEDNPKGEDEEAIERLDRASESLACFSKVLEIAPPFTESWFEYGEALRPVGQLDNAFQWYDAALDFSPWQAPACHGRGLTLEALGRPDEAVAAYDEAVLLDPRLADAWASKGGLLSYLGRREEAVACFAKARLARQARAGGHAGAEILVPGAALDRT